MYHSSDYFHLFAIKQGQNVQLRHQMGHDVEAGVVLRHLTPATDETFPGVKQVDRTIEFIGPVPGRGDSSLVRIDDNDRPGPKERIQGAIL